MSDISITAPESSVVVEPDNATLTVVENESTIDGNTSVIVVNNTPGTSLQVLNSETSVLTSVTELEIVSVGDQGPIGVPGPTGPTGATGPAGTAGGVYTFIQNTPSALWAIQHNLGNYLPVVVIDSSGTTVEGDVEYIDNNNLTVSFSAPFAGVAYVG